MSILLDTLVVFVLLISVWTSYRKGLVRTVLSIIGYFISFFVAGYVSKMLSKLIFDNFFEQNITNNIAKTISDGLAVGGVDKAVDNISNLLPQWLSSILLNDQNMPNTAKNMLLQNNIEGAANNITIQVVKPVIVMIMSLAIFFILFLIMRMILKRIIRATGIINKIPVIGLVNGLLGGILGIPKAALYLIMIGVIAWTIILATTDSLPYLNTNIINNSNLFLLFYKINPFTTLI